MFSVRTFTGVTTADRMRPRPDGCGSRLQALPLYHGRGDGHGMQNPSLIRNARRRLSLRSIIERSTRRRPLVVLTTTRWRSVNASEQYEQIEDDDDYFEFDDQVEPVTAEELEAALAAEKAEASRMLKEARAKAAEVGKEEAKARAEEKHGPVFVAKSEEDLVEEEEEEDEDEDEEEAGRAFPVVAKKEQAADEDADAAETLGDLVEEEEEDENEEEEEVDAQTALVDAMAEFEEAKAAWLAAAAEAALGDVAAAAEAQEARAKLEEMAAIAGAGHRPPCTTATPENSVSFAFSMSRASTLSLSRSLCLWSSFISRSRTCSRSSPRATSAFACCMSSRRLLRVVLSPSSPIPLPLSIFSFSSASCFSSCPSCVSKLSSLSFVRLSSWNIWVNMLL